MQSHTVTDENTGIAIAEDGDEVNVTGLEQYLPPDLLESLQTIMGLWKYGLQVVPGPIETQFL